MTRFAVSATARSDLREIHDYIAADDPAAARPLQIIRVLSGYRDIAALFA